MFFPGSANHYNVNPFSHLPPPSSSSSFHLPQPLLGHEPNDNVLLNHHLRDLVSASSLLPAAAIPQQLNLNEALLNMALLNKDGNHGVLGFGGGGVYDLILTSPPPGFGFPVNKAPKKDRHSKICTAQGVRERRVRLSIEIARDFFDLQDMLGFDKASKTVEWLLRKSRNAIKELAKMKQYGNVGCAVSQTQNSDDDQYKMVAKNRVLDVDGGESNSLEQEGVVPKEKKTKKLQKSAAIPLKVSREKARARAKERTREKMYSGSGSSSARAHEWQTCPDSSPYPSSSLPQLETSKKPGHLAYGHNMASSSFKIIAHQVEQPSETSRENVAEQSIVIRRMLKPSAILGYQQSLASCNSSDSNGFPNLSQNWDINGAMAHSTLCAITDVNLSTGTI
ncbi:hypothetical protein V6N11_075821 [Hibiscus sabdariffa]|uniref:Uncharacterized protein n=1 Tax=Hibiscus sabdariffa TaxID=183260 RepID=A0ABR2Q4E2_9ROSI